MGVKADNDGVRGGMTGWAWWKWWSETININIEEELLINSGRTTFSFIWKFKDFLKHIYIVWNQRKTSQQQSLIKRKHPTNSWYYEINSGLRSIKRWKFFSWTFPSENVRTQNFQRWCYLHQRKEEEINISCCPCW